MTTPLSQTRRRRTRQPPRRLTARTRVPSSRSSFARVDAFRRGRGGPGRLAWRTACRRFRVGRRRQKMRRARSRRLPREWRPRARAPGERRRARTPRPSSSARRRSRERRTRETRRRKTRPRTTCRGSSDASADRPRRPTRWARRRPRRTRPRAVGPTSPRADLISLGWAHQPRAACLGPSSSPPRAR